MGKKIAATTTLILSVIFFGLTALFIYFISDHNNKMNIIENGTMTYAEIMEIDSNTTVNDEPLYRLRYRFINESTGEITWGQTGDKYSWWELINDFRLVTTPDGNGIHSMDDLKIYYLANGNSIEADYADVNDSGIFYGLAAGFGVACAVAITACIISFRKHRLQKGILTYGAEAIGTFIDMKGGIIINGTQYFKIVYSWQNDTGAVINETSPANYSYGEALRFQNSGTFNIKYLGNKSVIDGLPEYVEAVKASTKTSVTSIAAKCEYCGSIVPAESNKCLSCGGRIKR